MTQQLWNWNTDFKNYYYNDNIRSLINLHHINSYNDFIKNKIAKILDEPMSSLSPVALSNNDKKGIYFKKDNISFNFIFTNPDPQSLIFNNSPNISINKNLDYKYKLMVDVEINIDDLNKKITDEPINTTIKQVKLCELPIMIFSNECSLYKQIYNFINFTPIKYQDDITQYFHEQLDKISNEELKIQEQQEQQKKIDIMIHNYNNIRTEIINENGLLKQPDKSINDILNDKDNLEKYNIINKIKKYILNLNNENIYENGGYFIINGKEKVLVSQDRLCNNKLYTRRQLTGRDNQGNEQYNYICEIKSVDILKQDFKPAKTTYIKFKQTLITKNQKSFKTNDYKKYKNKIQKEKPKKQQEQQEQQKQEKEQQEEQKQKEQEKEQQEQQEQQKKTNEQINDEIESKTRNIEENNLKTNFHLKNYYRSIYLTFIGLNKDIPIYIIFKALGFESDKDIHNFILDQINYTQDQNIYLNFKDILDYCRYDCDNNNIYTQGQALLFIYDNLDDKLKKTNYSFVQKKTIAYKLLYNNMLPHCNPDTKDYDNNKKALFLGYSIKTLLYVFFQYENVSDRDTYKFKRLDSSGKLLSSLFRDFYVNLNKNILSILNNEYNKGFEKSKDKAFLGIITNLENPNDEERANYFYKKFLIHNDIYSKFSSKFKKNTNDIITEGFRRSFRGNWGVKNVVKQVTLSNINESIDRDQYSFNKEGISQELKRMSHIDTTSHLRRVQTPMDSTIKLTGPRKVNTTQYGFICPLDTPEGALSGLIKNLAIQTSISDFNKTYIEKIKLLFQDLEISSESEGSFILTEKFRLTNEISNYIKIFINNDWIYSYIGNSKTNKRPQPYILYQLLKLFKRNNIINYQTSISWNIIKKEIHIFVDEGRYLRPVYVIKNQQSIADYIQNIKQQELKLQELQIQQQQMQQTTNATQQQTTNATQQQTTNATLQELQSLSPLPSSPESSKTFGGTTNENIRENIGLIKETIDNPNFNYDYLTNIEFYLTLDNLKTELIEELINLKKEILNKIQNESKLIRDNYRNSNFNQLLKHNIEYTLEEYQRYINLFKNVISNDLNEDDYKLLYELESQQSAIEFIDPEESELTLIAMNINEIYNTDNNYEYMDMHPSLIFGGLTSSMSFLNHNPCVRATYSHAQSKQSIAIPTTNFNYRFDTKMLILNYPQKSMHITKNAELINYNKMPTGNNAIVAMTSFLGYNQEDGIVINKSSLDRGMYSASHYITYYIELETSFGAQEEVLKPVNQIRDKKKIGKNYNKIKDGECFVSVGTYITENDIIVSKVFVNKDKTETDTSATMESTPFKDLDENEAFEQHNGGYVVSVFSGINSDDNKIVKIKICSSSPPEIADKFCSRYANKGVVSLIVPTEDMPYTKSGIVPDILINAHSIPSRMTVSNLLEIFTGKISAESGYNIDGSPFETIESSFENIVDSDDPNDKLNNEKSIMDLLNHYGFENYGNEFMYNGATGEQLLTKIFVGPAYYQRLKHIVRDKVNARSEGPKDQLTKQPIKGRKRGGGIRLGEMERDSIISHGINNFLKEGFLDRSDMYSCIICKLCGKIAIYNFSDKLKDSNQTNIHSNAIPGVNSCRFCNNKKYFSQVMLPYCSKLLIQEIETASVAMRLVTEDTIN